MRRLVLCLPLLMLATAVGGGTRFSLDRTGVLWSASSQADGLVLVAQRDGVELLRTTVPFANAIAGANDSDILVAADELTGKVAVIWQRNWSPAVSEIMLGVWNAGAWERVEALSSDAGTRPRFPAAQLSSVRSTVPDPAAPDDPNRATVIEDSFLHVVWWEGDGGTQHGTYAIVRLTAAPGEAGAVTKRNLDDFVWGTSCWYPAPASVLERPLFAAQPARDRAFVFHGSRRACLFQLVEVSFRLEDPPGGGIIVTAQRRRHTPVFGVRKLYSVPGSMSLDGARILVGADLVPVAYRVSGGKVEYISSTGVRWSPKRTLAVDEDLTLDRAIPLIENLAR